MFDDRILRLGVEVNGQLQVYEGAAITVKIGKTGDDKQNTCDATIANLLLPTIDYLVAETSPWNPNAKPKLLTVEAGRASTGTAVIYVGDITSAIPTMPPDRILSLKSKTQENAKYIWKGRQSTKTVQLSELAKHIADDYGVRLQFEATDKTISNYLYNGPLAKQVQKLAQVGDVDVFVDDDTLVVKNFGKGLKGKALLVSASTNMIGVPVPDEKGVKVRVMFDPNIKLGQLIEIKSDVNKAVNGQYTIYAMVITLASRDKDWYLDLSCNNDNIKSIAEKREASKKKDGTSK